MFLCGGGGGLCHDEVKRSVIGQRLQMNGLDAILMTGEDMVKLLQGEVNVLGLSELEFRLMHISDSTELGVGKGDIGCIVQCGRAQGRERTFTLEGP